MYWNKEQWKDVDDEAKVILKQLVKKVGDYHASPFEKVSDFEYNYLGAGLFISAGGNRLRIFEC